LHIANGQGESVTIRSRDSITVFAANSVTIRVTAKAGDLPVVSQRSSDGDVAARQGDRDAASCVIGIRLSFTPSRPCSAVHCTTLSAGHIECIRHVRTRAYNITECIKADNRLAWLAGLSCKPQITRNSLNSLRTRRTFWARITFQTLRPLWTRRSLRTRRPLWAHITFQTLRPPRGPTGPTAPMVKS
jgi:hypothetical protein